MVVRYRSHTGAICQTRQGAYARGMSVLASGIPSQSMPQLLGTKLLSNARRCRKAMLSADARAWWPRRAPAELLSRLHSRIQLRSTRARSVGVGRSNVMLPPITCAATSRTPHSASAGEVLSLGAPAVTSVVSLSSTRRRSVAYSVSTKESRGPSGIGRDKPTIPKLYDHQNRKCGHHDVRHNAKEQPRHASVESGIYLMPGSRSECCKFSCKTRRANAIP